jgi:hypothetical protein
MNTQGQIDHPPSKKTLGLITGGALVAAGLILVGFVLPAEFHADPTGFGRATGLLKLGTPQAKTETIAAPTTTTTTRYYPTAYRSDVVEIPLAAAGNEERKDELEYKVRMKVGDSFVYAWTAPVADPESFYFDFHGETPAAGAAPAKVVEYKQSTGVASNGTLIAPIAGVHGWYLQNQSDKPVVVKLKLSGFYELVPPGEYGNEAGIKAREAS